ncbi:MAG: DNA topoisomerase VI subunit B [Thermoplasmataceae archaeon]
MVSKPPSSHYKEISIAEFFEKNRHILGFDSPQKSVFMIVKEALDNSLDACEEGRYLPEIYVEISRKAEDVFAITVRDNGPGIERLEIPKVFGQLLYGSRFHSVRQSRGQQGIGITAAILYGQITTGESSRIVTRTPDSDVGFEIFLQINVRENRGNVISEKPVIVNYDHGTEITITAKGKYQVGKQSVIEYLKETAVVNPDMNLTFVDPDGRKTIFKRSTEVLPEPSVSIKPHPLGLEPGEIIGLASTSTEKSMKLFLSGEFNRVSERVAQEILTISGVGPEADPKSLKAESAIKLQQAFRKVKLMPPPVDCLSPLGEEYIRRGLRTVYEEMHPAFYSKPVMRPVSVYSGNPFSVEVGIVYGGEIKADDQVKIIRYANKVPLLYQAGACAITKAISEVDWRPYGMDQKQGIGIPFGPMIILVHVFSTRVPYTSESKEAIAAVPEISEEIKFALKSVARGLKSFMNKNERREKASEKFDLVMNIIPSIGRKCASILGKEEPKIDMVISRIANTVFINETHSKNENCFDVLAKIFNYTTEERSFDLYAEPFDGEVEGEAKWTIESIPPASVREIKFRVRTEAERYSGTEYFTSGIDPVLVHGAEPLPGDWSIREEVEEDEQ